MKIAYLCSSLSFGGLEYNHLRNAKWMQQRGHKVFVIGISNSPFLQRAKELELNCIELKRHRKYYDFIRALQLKKILLRNNIGFLFIRDTRDISISASIKYLCGTKIKTCYFMEMQLGVSKKNLLHTLRFSFLDFWFCPLKYMVEQVKTMTHMKKNKILLLPSALDLSQIKIKSKIASREFFNMEESTFYFGLIGRFDAQKGQELLLHALNICTVNNFKVIFLGEATKNEKNNIKEKMDQFIRDNSLENRVQIHQFIEDVSMFYSAIDCLIMATKAESFGMVSLEAIAHQVPVLGSDKGGTPDLLSDGKFGTLFKSMDANDLAYQMQQMVKSKFQINRMDLSSYLMQFDHHEICNSIERTVLLTSSHQ